MREHTGPLIPDDDRSCRWSARTDDGVRTAPVPSRTRLARSGERLAATHLEQHHGFEVLALNHRVAVEDVRGELDIVAFDARSRLLVVCEVKTRSSRRSGGALVALSRRQQLRIRRMTAVMLTTGRLHVSRVRFDLVAVDLSRTAGRADLVHLAEAW
jgi:putative endonuclease